MIQDRAFAGATHLKTIQLVNIKPQNCKVGQNLLQGTEAEIVVENRYLSVYKIDYTWSQYTERITAE